MKKQNGIFTIKALERLNNSYYGNPAYKITAENENGETITGRTASNATIGYQLGYTYEGRTVSMCYHTTRGGSLIFDYLKD